MNPIQPLPAATVAWLLTSAAGIPSLLAQTPPLQWTNPGPGGGSFLWSAAFHPQDGGATFLSMAGTELGLTESSTVIHKILFDPNEPGRVYAATGEGVIRSTNHGLSWAPASAGLPSGP